MVRRGLADHVVDRVIDTVSVYHPRAIRRHFAGPKDFATTIAGARITAVRRRGKYLWLLLDDDRAVLGHLGMSGQLLVNDESVPDQEHLRVRFRFADGDPELRFVDQRTFGGLSVWETNADIARTPTAIAHIARDPLDDDFDDDAFATALRKRRTSIKRALLDQSLISGVGNIYADEALWHAKLHFTRPTETATRPELRRLLAAARQVMTLALNEGGTSFDALYVNVNGEGGYFDRSLAVYGREGGPCRRCGTAIRRSPFMNRSSYWCPKCQPRPRRSRA